MKWVLIILGTILVLGGCDDAEEDSEKKVDNQSKTEKIENLKEENEILKKEIAVLKEKANNKQSERIDDMISGD